MKRASRSRSAGLFSCAERSSRWDTGKSAALSRYGTSSSSNSANGFAGGEDMPRKPRRPCGKQGCSRLAVEGGQYCEVHMKEERDRYNKYERSPDTGKKYGRAWKRIRDRYAEAHPLCEMCLKEGRLTPVEEVHHILPISQGGDHRRSNLMSLCQSCHNKIHHDLGDR